MTWLNPALWDDFGTVGIAVFAAVAVIWLVATGRVIPAGVHREIVGSKDATLAEMRARAKIDAETIHLQAQTIAERDAMEDTTTRLLQAVREVAGGQQA